VRRLLSADPLAVAFLVLGVAMLSQALRLSMRSLDGGPGPGLLPAALGALMLIFAGRIVLGDAANRPTFGHLPRVAMMVVGLALFGVAMDRLGFVLTAAAVMVLLLLLFNARRRALLAALGVAGAVATYALFYAVLRVQLPADPWGLWR
jgi:disulfide bond formation protein DsbB